MWPGNHGKEPSAISCPGDRWPDHPGQDPYRTNVGAAKNQFVSDGHGHPGDQKFLDEHFEGIMDYQFTAEIKSNSTILPRATCPGPEMLSVGQAVSPAGELTQNEADHAHPGSAYSKGPLNRPNHLTRMSRFGPKSSRSGNPKNCEADENRSTPICSRTIHDLHRTGGGPGLVYRPRDLGNTKANRFWIGAGRFGPYVKYGDQFISPPGEDPLPWTWIGPLN